MQTRGSKNFFPLTLTLSPIGGEGIKKKPTLIFHLTGPNTPSERAKKRKLAHALSPLLFGRGEGNKCSGT
jgi:hypothetical protein